MVSAIKISAPFRATFFVVCPRRPVALPPSMLTSSVPPSWQFVHSAGIVAKI
jgi:hypothetical protein